MRWLFVVTLLLAAALPVGNAAAGTTAERSRVVELVNQERGRNGLAPLAESGALTNSAEAYALYMATANFFGHTGLDGSTLRSRAEGAGYTGWTWLGENIAAGQTSPDAVLQAWMNSPGHRANILSPSAREIGIGHANIATSRYGHYWTMSLGNRPGANGPASAPPEATPAASSPTPVPTAPAATPQPARPLGAAAAFRLHVPVGPKSLRGSL